MTLVVEPDATAAANAAAHFIAGRLTLAVQAHGRATIAFSGGATPGLMFDALAVLSVPWSQVEVFQVDERAVAEDSLARNWHDLRSRLLDPAHIPEHQQHPMNVTSGNLTLAAGGYADDLRTLAPDGIDIVHLGLGDDGHTASWPPGDSVIRSADDVAVVGPYRGTRRMTLTPRVVNRAGLRLWLVAGAEKKPALAALLQQDQRIPASSARLSQADVIIADAAAAPPD